MKQNYFLTTTPTKPNTPMRNVDRMKRFSRKPDGTSQRSMSRKSQDNKSLKDMYIKSPGPNAKRPQTKQEDFFVSLASSIIKTQELHEKKNQNDRYKCQKSDRTAPTEWGDIKQSKSRVVENNQSACNKLSKRVQNLQAELDLKNHEASVLSSQCQRLKKTVDQEKQRRRKIDNQKKQIQKQLKQVTKSTQSLKLQLKKLEREKQHLSKQIQFLERINYDDKTRSMQSYKQNYLQNQIQKIRKQFSKSKEQRQNELQIQIKSLKQQKFNLQSHLKATKVANECLVKQINNFQQGIQDIVLNSQQYKKLRDKYIRFLQEYKLLRNEYWTFKAEMHKKNGYGSSDQQSQIFSITASEVQNDLSQLKPAAENMLHQLNITHSAKYK